MGISYQKRIKVGDGTFLNISKSGVSISQKVGKITINLGKVVTYRTSKKKKK